MSAQYEILPPGGHETYATSIFSKIKTYLDSNPYGPVKDIPNTPIAIASFNDGSDLPMPKLEVAIEPQQDLHGYDAPWVGGAGKNKLPLTVDSIKHASDKSTWNNNSITINGITYEIQVDTDGNVLGIKTNGTASGDSNLRIYDGDAEFNGKILNGCPSNGSINAYYMQLSNVTIGSDYDLGNGTVINQTDTGRWILIINIKSGTTVSNLMFYPMIRLATETDPTFAPYSNICPISGWNEANVTRCGKNLFDRDSIRRGVYTKEDGTTQSGSATTNFSSQFIKVKPNTIYSITMFEESYENGSLFGIYYDEDKNGINQKANIQNLISNNSKTFTTPSNAHYIVFTGYRGSGTDIFTTANTMVCEGTPTTYEPFNGNTYNIQFKDGSNPLTVYGGTLDVVSGLLTVDRAYVDLGTLYYSYYSGNLFTTQISNLKPVPNTRLCNALCSIYVAKKGNDYVSIDGSFVAGFNNAPTLAIHDSRFTDATAFKTAMNGVQLVYELATPLTIQLTPTQVKSLLGFNNIWADSGDVLDAEYIRNMYDNITAKYAAYAYNSGNADTASKLGSSNVGSATQPIYLNAGTATACTYTLGKSVPSDAIFTDTKNTAGSTDTSSKIFLIGATSQAANPQTYSQDTAYVGTDGCLYSGGTKVLTAHQDISGKADKSATVSTVEWSNNKLTKTINGTTSDVVSAATILGNLTSSQVTTALGYVPGPSYYFESSDNSIAFSSSMVPGRETVDMTVNGKVSTAGDTISGDLDFLGSNVCLKTSGSSSDDSGDIVFYHGNGNEKSRIWVDTEYTTAMGPNYRVYKKDGTSLYSGRLATLNDLSWGNISEKPSSFTPAAHNHTQINDRGNVTAEAGANRPAVAGLSMVRAYNNGYPANYGNVITLNGSGCGEIFVGWSGSSGQHAPCYVRSKRDTSDASWSGWSKIFTASYPPTAVECGALPTTGGTLTGQLTITKGRLQLGSSKGSIVCSTALISRHDTGDSGYINHVNYGNTAYAPIRASAYTTMSCKHTKTNVVDISEEDALKLLNIRPVNFDYIEEVGGQKNQIGVLAEDTYEVLPKVVNVPDDYVEEEFDISKGIHQPLPSVDYAKFVPYLIKLVQMQQKEINELKTSLRALV